ncbi:MAG TPA: rhamnulokinase family protein [Candidatus Methylacidiphilales bacterium]|jgi:rhamnulokinase|nr:rhamnulokinase family protein [Candidatus Methylacidiphilales bacterium]
MNAYLAVDLGAESGRVMLGTLDGGRVRLEEIHRFPNRSYTENGHFHWDLPHLQGEIFTGIEKAAARGTPIAGISTDSWGVDYVLLDAKGNAIGNPYCYRDARTHAAVDRLHKTIPFGEIYAETGIQFMTINTIYHFEAQQHADKTAFANADHFLGIADYFNAQLGGEPAAEQSLASTTQLYNPRTQTWSEKIAATLSVKKSLFPRIVPSGTVLGPVIGKLAALPALAQTKVIASCSHDTGAAVAAVPATGDNWAYLSSGTWSLLGAELREPVISDAARIAGFTNEVGLGGTIRFLKNIAGLWVLQECRRAWEAAGQKFSYEELTQLAADNGPAAAHLNLSDPRFLAPGDMPEKITAFCRETAQPVPAKPGEFARTILESLALTYAQTLAELEKITSRKISSLNIVGGGSRSELLNQLTADATGIRIVAGPVEATAVGNILIQALALGHLASRNEVRRVVEDSFVNRTYMPGAGLITKSARARFHQLEAKKS